MRRTVSVFVDCRGHGMGDGSNTESIGALVDELTYGDITARAHAAEALGRQRPQARAAVPALIKALSDSASRVWTRAGHALFVIGPDATAVPALVRELTNEQLHVRCHSARALVKTQPSPIDALPALLRAVREEEDWPVVDSVWWALHVIGPASVPPLDEMLRHGDPRTRRRAAYCLMSGRIERLQRAIVPLLHALDDEDGRVRRIALQSLGWNAVRYKRAAGTFDEAWAGVPQRVGRCLADADVGLRWEAARTLLQFGPDARPAIADLTSVLGDDDEQIRTWAALSLRAIQQGQTV